jgi:DNA polymerase-3 subunit gamma/tau
MTDLASKYRPSRFSEVVGQGALVGWMRNQIRSRERRSVLIAGPIGTGKTTSGWIYAKGILCSAPRDGEACEACEECLDFGSQGQRSPDFRFFNCGEHSTIEKVQELLEFARATPFVADRRVLVLDEAHNLSRRAFQGLLNIIERPPEWASFILLTSEKNVLPPALLSRLHCEELQLLKRPEAFGLLKDICSKEGMVFEPEALDLAFSAVGGSPRVMLRALESVREFGPINMSNVRSALRLDFDERLVAYVRALLDRNRGRQLQLIDDWPDTPSRKLGFLHQLFTYSYLNGVCRIERRDAIVETPSADVKEDLLREFATRADLLMLDVEAFWESAISTLEPREGLTGSQLAMILSRTDRLINGGPQARSDTPSQRQPPRQRILRVSRDRAITEPESYLSWAQARSIWEAGTFLPQQTGVLFNMRLTLDHIALGMEDHSSGAHLVSGLTHELGERIAYWMPQSFYHWIYAHEATANGDLVSRILLAMPNHHLARATAWLEKFIARRTRHAHRGFLVSQRRCGSAADRVRFHWQGIRALTRCLDPALVERDGNGNLVPLVDLLQIPVRWRAPLGVIQTAQGKGTSKSLTPTTRKKAAREMKFLSALKEHAWHYLDRGWEIEEHRARLAEVERRQSAIEQVGVRFSGDDALSVARRNEELRIVRAAFLSNPKAWPRSWSGWWQPTTLRSEP